MQRRLFSRFLPGALALVVMTLPLSSSAQQIYRWKDANGTVNFTHTPPPDGQEAQKTTIAPSSASGAPAAVPNAASSAIGQSDSAHTGGAPAASPEQSQASAQAKAVECQEARRQLKLMASGTEVARMGSDGKPVALEGAARAQEMQRLREFVLKSCEQ